MVKQDKALPKAGAKPVGFLSRETYEKMRALLDKEGIVMDPTQFEISERAGVKFYRIKATTLRGERGGGGGGDAADFPFRPVISGSEADGYFVKITPGIMRRGDTGEGMGIEGIDTEFAAGDNQCVFLEMDVDEDFQVTLVTARCAENWEGYPKKYQAATEPPYAQTKAYIELGRVGGTGEDLKVNNAWASGHLLLDQAIVTGRLVWEFRGGN